MKPPSLAELRAQQKAQGLVAPRADDESFTPSAAPIRHEIPAAPPAPNPEPPRVAIGASQAKMPPLMRGFIALLPPKYPTLASLPPEWEEENWNKPSPWCHIEGQPDHPEFEANLKAWEDSQR